MYRLLTLLGVLMCLGFVTIVATQDLPIRILVNDVLIKFAVPARIEHGVTVAPIRPIVEALGATIYRNENLNEIYINRDPWLTVDHEPSWGRVSPYGTTALGAILTLRRHLSEKQWETLNSQNPTTPLLARFEIIDVYSNVSPPGLLPGLPPANTHLDSLGFRIIAVLYWAYFASDDDNARLASTLIRSVSSEGRGISQVGPQLAKVQIETVRYMLEPKNSGDSQAGNEEFLHLGSDGWSVKELGRTEVFLTSGQSLPALQDFDLNGNDNDILPFYDLSVVNNH